MRKNRRRRPIEFHQVCGIARTVIEADPTIDNFEWKESTREIAARQGYDTIPGEMLQRAIAAMGRALAKLWGPRPVHLPPRPSKPAQEVLPPQLDPPWPKRSYHPQGWTPVQHLASPKPHGAGSPNSSEVSVKVTRPLTLREVEVRKAARILAQGILEQIRRCEELEGKEPDK